MKKNIFVFGLNDSNRAQLALIPNPDDYVFHSLLSPEELVEAEAYDFDDLLDKARKQLKNFPGSIDGLITFWDFPSPELKAILCKEFNLPAPSVEALIKCSHKYLSRVEQKKVIPDNIPGFQAINPFDKDPLEKIKLNFPFYLKPVKSYASYLSFYVAGPEDFQDAIATIRKSISRYGGPYNSFLNQTSYKDYEVNAEYCIAEEMVFGKMCTIEGYSYNNQVTTFGLVDSHRFPGKTTFSRYQYPSSLSLSVRKRIDEIAEKVIKQIGYDNGAFNIEFFYDKRLDKIWLLEINPRVSQSHSNLFYKVDGAPNQKVLIDIATDVKPEFPWRKGEYKYAAKFYLREFQDGIVSHVPDNDTIQEIEEEFPGAIILPHVKLGDRLSDLHDQEPYSYRLGVVYLGGDSQQQLLDKFRVCKSSLGFRIRPEYPLIKKRGRKPADTSFQFPKIDSRGQNEVEVIEHTWIPMRDGTRLSARIWRPKNSNQAPVPAVLEYIPYRKRDHTRRSDEMAYNYLAAHGFACLRVDMRGSGESEGILEDEYLSLEQRDGIDILNWIGERSWCDGKIGMIGISWGGFNSLQIAALKPAQLKAIITVCSTDDRYNDDVHYMGGTMLADNLSWASIMFARNTQPPDPEIVGEKWYDMWLERLEGSGLWLEKWMRHPWRDEYWKHGSICEDYSAITCPVLAVGGWADGYSNAIFRLLDKLEVPCKGIIGPWSHTYPHFGKPGPAIGFLQETLRWWNHWLKGIDSGIESDPALTVWMQNYAKPMALMEQRPGKWLTLPQWPDDRIKEECFYFNNNGGLSPCQKTEPDEKAYKVQSPLSVGLFGGKWCSYSVTPDLPHDQREADGGSLIFESEPLKKQISILGSPEIELDISANRPVAMVAVRLSEISPDDKASRITYGLLNLTHRDSQENPEPLKEGKRYVVKLALNEIAQTINRGHRLRIAISSSYFPVAWATPEPVCLSIFTGISKLQLPVLPKEACHKANKVFQEPVVGPYGTTRQLEKPERGWFIKRNMMNEVSTVEILNDEGKVHHEEIGLDVATKTVEKYSYQYDDHDSLRGETRCEMLFERPDWKVETITNTVLTSSKHRFIIRATLDAYLNGARVFSKSWDEKIPRKLL